MADTFTAAQVRDAATLLAAVTKRALEDSVWVENDSAASASEFAAFARDRAETQACAASITAMLDAFAARLEAEELGQVLFRPNTIPPIPPR